MYNTRLLYLTRELRAQTCKHEGGGEVNNRVCDIKRVHILDTKIFISLLHKDV